MGVCYHWQAEPLFFGWIPNGGHRWYGGRKQTTVWQIDRPAKSPEHPTMKPVELVARAIENSSLSDEIVYEPFSGSGTTIMACEQLGRRCRAVEIAPGYVAVALERWATATGKTPELIFSVDNLSQ
jgi:DNA modification methylase